MGGGQQLADNTRLNMLFEKQNNKQNSKIGGGETNNQLNGNSGRSFERGDLRNSLREKRAATELQSAGKGEDMKDAQETVITCSGPVMDLILC